jgi:hypothetical protein
MTEYTCIGICEKCKRFVLKGKGKSPTDDYEIDNSNYSHIDCNKAVVLILGEEKDELSLLDKIKNFFKKSYW